MKWTEEKMDLFKVPQGYYLAHCISDDFSLGAGIARSFDDIFNMHDKLKAKYPFAHYDNDSHVGKALLIDNVYNLVTKEKYHDKPTYDDLTACLCDMKYQMNNNLTNKLAIPRLGCGLDRLDWNRVQKIIIGVFCDTDVEVLVCTL